MSHDRVSGVTMSSRCLKTEVTTERMSGRAKIQPTNDCDCVNQAGNPYSRYLPGH